MTHRAIVSLMNELREELGSDRAALEACARAVFDFRNVAPDELWARSAMLRRTDVAPLLARDDVLGAAYQSLTAPALEVACRVPPRERRKFTQDETSSVPGLYTPLWLAERLVRETVGNLWRQSDSKPRV